MDFSVLIDRVLIILDLVATSALNFFDWLFTKIDMGILGYIEPIYLISFTVIASMLIVRIILAINQ